MGKRSKTPPRERPWPVEALHLRAPFPWFGGKSRCAHIVWERFGDVPNFVDPFCGSLAVPLGRPHPARTETFNDKDAYLANFWRAVMWDPEAVAYFADWPINEADLHPRHRWLVDQKEFREKMLSDPHFYDAKIAGWWVWGISQWIGSGWCSRPEWKGRNLPGRSNRGTHSARLAGISSAPRVRRDGDSGVSSIQKTQQYPASGRNAASRMGQWKTRPFLSSGGQGINAVRVKRPRITGWGNTGVHAKMPGFERAPGSGVLRTEYYLPPSQLPSIGGDGSGQGRGTHSESISHNLTEYMFALADRLRNARVCCGDWQRILGPSPTTCIGVTAVFLDPPYLGSTGRDPSIYNAEDLHVAHEVRRWAIAHGNDHKLRIALCGYEGEHRMPKTWQCVPWKANGGYGNQTTGGMGRANAHRERIWFSPHCLQPQGMLL